MLVARILRSRRASTSVLAWLLAIALVPYLGIPLYLVFGGRKLRRVKSEDPRNSPRQIPPDDDGPQVEQVLCAMGVAPSSRAGEVVVLPTGEEAFAALIALHRDARRSIHIATFILGDDEVGDAILDLLMQKAQEGLEVRLLLDGLFSARASRRRLRALRQAGGELAFFMPLLHLPFRGYANLRNHRKIVVVDRARALVGGMNLAREYMGPTPIDGRWCDLMVRETGDAVAPIDDIFRADWAFAAGGHAEASSVPNSDGAGMSAPAPPAGTDASARIQVVPSGPDVQDDPLYDALLAAFFEARQRIWIATPYFIPDEALTRALSLAARRGLDVRVVVPKRSNHRLADLAGVGYLQQLQSAGGRVRPFIAGMLHAKVALIDDTVGVVGSAILDMRSLFLDYEVALFCYSAREIAQLQTWFDGLWPRCDDGMPRPGRLTSLAQDVGRLLAPLA